MKKRRRLGPRVEAARESSSQAIVRKVIRLEKLVWKAAQRRDAETFRRLVPEDAVMIFRSGVVPQPDYLKTMPKRTIRSCRLHNIRGFMPNPTTVILLYRTVRLGNESGRQLPTEEVIESTTWIRRSGAWVAILNQETPVGVRPTSRRISGRS